MLLRFSSANPGLACGSRGDIGREDLKEAVLIAHRLGAKLYVNMNKLFRNHELDELPDYLRAVKEAEADAIVFGDPAVLMYVRACSRSSALLECRNDGNEFFFRSLLGKTRRFARRDRPRAERGRDH